MCMHLIKEFWNPLKVFDENLVDSQIEIIDIRVMVISNFHTPLSITDTINGHKISKDIWDLNNIVNLIDITDVYRTLHSTMTNIQGIFTKRDYVWVINLSIKLKMTQVIQSTLTMTYYETNKRKTSKKIPQIL